MESDNENKLKLKVREGIQDQANEIIESIDTEKLDSEKLEILQNILNFYKDLLNFEKELQEMTAKNQKQLQKTFFFISILFISEAVYSLLAGYGYVEPLTLKTLMLVFIFFLMGMAYTQFRN